MYAPHETTSSERLADFYGEYLLARLKSDPDVVTAIKGFESAQTALRQVNEAERAAYRRESAAVAVRDHADFRLDETVRGFELALLASVSKNRQAREYKACFPDGLTAVIAAPVREETQAVKRIQARLAELPSSDFKKHLASLTAARQALESADSTLEEATNGHASAMTREMTARREWIRSYRVTYAELLSLFPENKRRVEAYFRPRSGGERIETEEAAASTPAARS